MNPHARCPRCNGAFVCEAETALQAPCACFAVKLSDAARAALRERYATCVCVPCLRAVQSEFEFRPPEGPPAP